MNILIETILVGAAVGYVAEFLVSLADWLGNKFVKALLTISLSVGAFALFGHLDLRVIVLAPAAGFFALVVLSFVTKPVAIQNIANRRL
jgi:uncharacterized membrane protein SirB2